MDKKELKQGLLYVLIGCAIILVGEVIVTFWACHGNWQYTMDDPYIALRVGENLLHGHYGINLAEHSSPCSSILYPFVITGLMACGLGDFAPLALNVVCALATAALLFVGFYRFVFAGAKKALSYSIWFTFACLLLFNVLGVVFAGLEHSLHILTSLAIAYGLISMQNQERIPKWFLFLLILNPLIRFEGLALSGAGILYLAFRRRWMPALLVSFSIVALLAIYVMGMHAMGLPPLPSSVLSKSSVTASVVENSAPIAFAKGFAATLFKNLRYRSPVLLLGAVLAWFIFKPGSKWNARLAAAVGTAAVAGHVCVGQFGWPSRYEDYLLVFAAFLAACFGRAALVNLMQDSSVGQKLVFAGMSVVLCCQPFMSLLVTPWRANNIYQQQFQMHRFATEFYNRPVAVNDLGWVSYNNTNYVLDYGGLASEQARIMHAQAKPEWMSTLAAQYQIGMVMIYDSWFASEIPTNWTKVAELELAGPNMGVAERAVSFYATPHADLPYVRGALDRFETSLPAGVGFRKLGSTPTSLRASP